VEVFFYLCFVSGKKINKETAIKSIVKHLKAGLDKKTIWKKLEQNGTVPKVTFYRWYNIADEEYQEFLSVANPIVRAKEIEALGQIAVSNILSKFERQQILSDIAMGRIPLIKHIVVNRMIEEVEIVPNWSDRKSAIDILNKMDGAYIQEDPDDEEEFNGFEIQDV